MKHKRFLTGIVAVSLIALVALAGQSVLSQQSAEELYQAALFKKEAEGSLDGALRLLKQIVATYAKNRAVAAKAQLQIGLCYEKLGQEKVKQAQEAFQKVLDTYPGETDVVKVARE